MDDVEQSKLPVADNEDNLDIDASSKEQQPEETMQAEDTRGVPELITESPVTTEPLEQPKEHQTEATDAPGTIINSQDLLDIPEKDNEDISLRSVSDGENSVFSDNPDCSNQQQLTTDVKQTESENESEELDDIELIFTTEETCRDVGLQEDLVSITDGENWQNTSGGQPILLKYTKSIEEVPVCNGEKTATSSVDEAVSSQSSSIDREESVDRFDESSNTRLNKMWSQCSVLVETDISKCGVVEEPEHSARHAARRNTLAAPPTAYR